MNNINIHTGTGESRVQSLIALLDVAERAEGKFEGFRKQGGVGRIYGGEVVAQALAAACKTVPDNRIVHSLHAYFLRGGDERHGSSYKVEADFDGRSFSNRRVIASQNDEVILNLAASFHVPEPGHYHQMAMPDVKDPEELLDHQDVIRKLKKSGELGWTLSPFLDRPWPIELRPILYKPAAKGEGGRQPLAYWFRAAAIVNAPQWMHRTMMAFVSDMGVLSASALSHNIAELQAASIDHSIWFHDDVDMNEWMLYHVESPWSGSARGVGIGHIFNRGGRLLATVSQEGLIRDRAFRHSGQSE